MSDYTLHPDAFTDLDVIRQYIAEGSPDEANLVITDIFKAIRA